MDLLPATISGIFRFFIFQTIINFMQLMIDFLLISGYNYGHHKVAHIDGGKRALTNQTSRSKPKREFCVGGPIPPKGYYALKNRPEIGKICR